MKKRIQISREYPAYWEYDGKPVILLGGSKEDNLFQIPDLEEHLALLSSVGGNYVRCTMSSRDPGDVWPFEKKGSVYDLNHASKEYWQRFTTFLDLTLKQDIIVQIECWDRFDLYRDPWKDNPFNPKNNLNYSVEESGLQIQYDMHPGKDTNRFFYSVPDEDDNQVILKYQQQFMDHLLAYSLEYPHVLYCIDNETSVTWRWGKYWSEYIKKKAKEKGVEVQITEMWDAHDLTDKQHLHTIDHPETYSFVDVSQNNHQVGQTHWDNGQKARELIASQVRPLNNVKIYGSDTYKSGTLIDGIERFWRNVMGKMASARFHRPNAGVGLSKIAQINIKSARMLTDTIDIFKCEPNNNLLFDREENEAYCLANSEKEIIVYFTRVGKVRLDTSGLQGKLQIKWLNINDCEWLDPIYSAATHFLLLETPLQGQQAVVIKSI